jgi:hypothetical protein
MNHNRFASQANLMRDSNELILEKTNGSLELNNKLPDLHSYNTASEVKILPQSFLKRTIEMDDDAESMQKIVKKAKTREGSPSLQSLAQLKVFEN